MSVPIIPMFDLFPSGSLLSCLFNTKWIVRCWAPSPEHGANSVPFRFPYQPETGASCCFEFSCFFLRGVFTVSTGRMRSAWLEKGFPKSELRTLMLSMNLRSCTEREARIEDMEPPCWKHVKRVVSNLGAPQKCWTPQKNPQTWGWVVCSWFPSKTTWQRVPHTNARLCFNHLCVVQLGSVG